MDLTLERLGKERKVLSQSAGTVHLSKIQIDPIKIVGAWKCLPGVCTVL